MEKQAPWFCSDSSAVPPVPFQFLRTSEEILSNQIRFPVQWSPQQSPQWPTLELRRNWGGTGLELRQHFVGTILEPPGNCIGTAEEPRWNRTRVPVSQCSKYPSLDCIWPSLESKDSQKNIWCWFTTLRW